MIIACIGYQRSGKTASAVLLARIIKNKLKNVELYSNIRAKGFRLIRNLSEIKDDDSFKVVLIDEAYINLDSRKYLKNADMSLFINTLSKRKILLILTSPLLNMLDKRVREQINYILINVYNEKYLNIYIVDVIRRTMRNIKIRKDEKLFKDLDYDTKYIPDIITNDFKVQV